MSRSGQKITCNFILATLEKLPNHQSQCDQMRSLQALFTGFMNLLITVVKSRMKCITDSCYTESVFNHISPTSQLMYTALNSWENSRDGLTQKTEISLVKERHYASMKWFILIMVPVALNAENLVMVESTNPNVRRIATKTCSWRSAAFSVYPLVWVWVHISTGSSTD